MYNNPTVSLQMIKRQIEDAHAAAAAERLAATTQRRRPSIWHGVPRPSLAALRRVVAAVATLL
jgi:hypothetical protein